MYGPQGQAGPTGLTGPTGITGMQGPQGNPGPTGPRGPYGATGYRSRDGPSLGPALQTYYTVDGPTGPTGAAGSYIVVNVGATANPPTTGGVSKYIFGLSTTTLGGKPSFSVPAGNYLIRATAASAVTTDVNVYNYLVLSSVDASGNNASNLVTGTTAYYGANTYLEGLVSLSSTTYMQLRRYVSTTDPVWVDVSAVSGVILGTPNISTTLSFLTI